MRRRPGAIGAPLLVLALLVAAGCAAAVAWPRAVDAVLTRSLQQQVAATGPAVRDLDLSFGPDETTGADTVRRIWDALPYVASGIDTSLPAALRPIAAPTRFWGRADGPSGFWQTIFTSTGTNTAHPGFTTTERIGPSGRPLQVSVEATPDLQRSARLVGGRWPTAVSSGAVPVAVSTTTAARLGWRVGHRVRLGSGDLAFTAVIDGIFTPRRASDDLWAQSPLRLAPEQHPTPDGPPVWQALVFVGSAEWPALVPRLGTTSIGFQVPLAGDAARLARITPETEPGIRGALAAVVAQQLQSPTDGSFVALQSGLADVLADADAAAVPVRAMIAVFASGPLVALVVLLGIASGSVAAARRRSDELLVHRGARPLGQRLRAARDTAIVTVPAAAVGGAVGVLAMPGRGGSPLVTALVVALLPPVLTAARTLPAAPGSRSRRARLVAECAGVAMAVLAVAVLEQRGVAGLDPVAIAAPVLVLLAVCVPLARVLPPLTRAAGRSAGRSRGVTGLLGGRIAARGPRLGPLVALTAAVGLAIAAVGAQTTLRDGVADVADRTAGADVLITADTGLPAASLARLGRLPYPQADVRDLGGARVATPTAGTVAVEVLAADPGAVARVQSAFPERDRTLAAFERGGGLSVGFALAGRHSLDLSRGTITARFAPAGGVPVPLTTDGYWALVDRAAVPAALERSAPVVAVLVGLPPGRASGAVSRIRAAAGGEAKVVSASAIAAATGSTVTPLVDGLVTAAAAAAALALLATGLALALALVASARERTRLAATLRALGMSTPQTAALTVWEAVPILVAGLAVGIAAGIGVAALLLQRIDVGPLIGSRVHPLLQLDPALIGLVAAATVVAAALGTGLATALARRADTAAVLRFQEGGS